uniref:Reverse transcriptase/retrotransposon-derived protein RNase H-like domain-containing protein n=1 Tax=Romanomermis culicivorax TaxID=13658 RepID=A0A915L5P2_ROMCU
MLIINVIKNDCEAIRTEQLQKISLCDSWSSSSYDFKNQTSNTDAQYFATDEHYAAFKGIKTALTSSPFLRYPVYDGKAQFVIQTDA